MYPWLARTHSGLPHYMDPASYLYLPSAEIKTMHHNLASFMFLHVCREKEEKYLVTQEDAF